MGEQYKWNPSVERMGQMMRQAVYVEDMVTLQHLVKLRADLQARDETGAAPLHIAATQSKPSTISWLLQSRANIDVRDSEGFSALTWACLKGHKNVVSALVAGRADIEEVAASSGKTPLSITAERGHFDCVQELLARGARLDSQNNDGSNALMCAAHHSEAVVVSHLLGRNCPVNSTDNDGWTAIMYAVNAEVPSASSGGEQAEMKVNIDGVMGRRSTTELLLLHKADVAAQTVEGLTPLIIASARNRPSAVKKLLENRAAANASSLRGQTALLMAAAHDLPEVVRQLVLYEANVNHMNNKQECALALAEKNGFKETTDILKKAGAVMPKGGKKKGKKK